MIIEKNKIKICDECKSEFNKDTSEMESLCPECSSILYGYQNCEHHFIENRCEKCYWNGNSSEYIKQIRNNK
jgi:predicted RNA-binding Zn-ribbon protein involved in translation (DUF1610 family)